MMNQPMKESILLYNIKGKAYTPKLKSILLQMGIRIKVVDPTHFSIPIKELITGTPSTTGAPVSAAFEDEMMIMCGLTNLRLDMFLAALRKNKIQIPLKAIATPHNIEWTSFELHDELLLEHQKMTELSEQNKSK